jgi:hypothetical protein
MASADDSGIERPVAAAATGVWGSDVVAQMLRALQIRYVALNPGSSFRGLHDSPSITSATRRRSCCFASTRNMPWRWRTAMPRSRASRWPPFFTAMSG